MKATTDLTERMKAMHEPEMIEVLLAEIRTLSELLTEKKEKNNGWIGRVITDRVIALILAILIALIVWVGATNVRLAILQRDVAQLPAPWMVNAVSDHEVRIRILEKAP